MRGTMVGLRAVLVLTLAAVALAALPPISQLSPKTSSAGVAKPAGKTVALDNPTVKVAALEKMEKIHQKESAKEGVLVAQDEEKQGMLEKKEKFYEKEAAKEGVKVAQDEGMVMKGNGKLEVKAEEKLGDAEEKEGKLDAKQGTLERKEGKVGVAQATQEVKEGQKEIAEGKLRKKEGSEVPSTSSESSALLLLAPMSPQAELCHIS